MQNKTELRPVLLVVTVLASVLLFSQASLGAGHQKEIAQNHKKHEEIMKVMQELKNQNKQLDGIVHDLDKRADKKQGERDAISKQLKTSQAKLTQIELDQDKCARSLTNYQSLLGRRARQTYIEGDLTYVDLLFQATSMADFIDRVFFVQAILEQDSTLIDNTRAEQEQMKTLHAAKEQQIASIHDIKDKLDSQIAELQDVLDQKKDIIAENDNDLALYEKRAAELEEANKRLAAIARSASGYSGKWSGSFIKPVPGPIMSPFGWRVHPIFHSKKLHTGVDIGASEGTPIHPGAKGMVTFAGWMSGYGNCVMVSHGGGISTLYGHMSVIKCTVGDIVTTDSVIGKVGMTGYATGPHLHFEKRVNGTPVDPLGSISGAGPVSHGGDRDE